MLNKAKIIILLILSAGSVLAENLIEDSSFELGIDRASTGNLFRWKKGNAFQGDYHAVLRGENAYFRTKKLDEIPSQYTFSVYMRSSKPGARAILRMGESRWRATKKEVQLTGDWKRCSMTLELKPYKSEPTLGKNNIFGCWIDNPDGATIDVDCAQWEKGGLSPYVMKSKPCIAANTVKYANIFFDNEELEYSVGVSNPGSQPENFLCKILIADQYGKTLNMQEANFSLKPQESLLKYFKIDDKRFGLFKVKVSLYNSNAQLVDSHEMHLARVANMADGKFHPDSFFGVCLGPNSTDPEIMKQQWNVYTGSGARWSRVFINWRTAEPKKNTYDWDVQYKDYNINEGYLRKMCQMLVITNVYQKGTPEWAIDKKTTEQLGFDIPDEKIFLDFVRTLINRYKGKINVWEILNEPYLLVDSSAFKMPAETREKYLNDVCELQKKMYQMFKELDPVSPAIINANGKGQLETKKFYLKSMLQKGLMDNVDGISWHWYRTKLPPEMCSITASLAEARQVLKNGSNRKSPMSYYQTESSTCSNDFFDSENNLYGEYNLMMNPLAFGYNDSELDAASCGIRASILEVSSGVKVTFWFLVGDYTDYKVYNLHSMTKDHWRSPKIIYPAYNAMSRMIDETKPLGQLNVGEKTQAHAFQKGDSVVIPYWYLMFESGLCLGKLEVDPTIPIEKLYDFMGNQINIEKENGKVLIPFGKAPNYLVCSLKNLPTVEAMLKNGALRDFSGETNVTVSLGSATGYPDVVTKIQNNSSNELSGVARIAKTPLGLTLSTSKVAFKNIGAMSSGTQRFPVKSVANCDTGKIVGIALLNGEKMIEFSKDTSLFVSSQATGEIKVDGSDKDWDLRDDSIKLETEDKILNEVQRNKKLWKGKNDLSGEIWSRWDNNMLYFLIKTKDDVMVQDFERIFMSDCVQLFIDCDTVTDMEQLMFNDDDIQFCFIPANDGKEGMVSVISPNKNLTKDGIKCASTKTQDGYVMEIAIPSEKLMQKRLTSGTAFGFNIAINDRDDPAKEQRRKTEMLWTGKDDKTWAFTDRLGYIILK